MAGSLLRAALPAAVMSLFLASWNAADAGDGLRVATFCCDVTPPLGQPMFSCDPLTKVEEPLLAKGVVLDSAQGRYVLCAIDWCELCNDSYDSMREKLAKAAGTEPSRVAIQTLHQHTAPLVDSSAQKLLAEISAAKGIHIDPEVYDQIESRLVAAVKDSLDKFEPFNQIGVGQAKVDRVASSRRCRDESGKIQPRMSGAGGDPFLAALPEGKIDPYLKTITLARDGKPLVRLHYYATHPQSRYGDGRATSDVPGIAREKLEKEEGAFQIYFTGCGGDITLGKYNDRSDAAREAIASRLLDGMKSAIAATKLVPATELVWRTAPVAFPRRTDAGMRLEDALARMKNPNTSPVHRLYTGAVQVAFHHRDGKPIELTSLQIGDVYIVHLPGEPMIDFQLFAQKLRPNDFVAVAGYGDCGTGYICSAAAYEEGGYEPTDANVKPESEGLMKKAISDLLDLKSSASLDHTQLMTYIAADGRQHPVQSPEDWAIRRGQILAGMEQVMGNLPDRSKLPPLDIHILETVDGEGYDRLSISYIGAEGQRVPAYLLLPKGLSAGQRSPAILALHQTTPLGKKEVAGEGGNPNLAYAKELAQRGYVVLAPDCPSFGDYPYDFQKSAFASATMMGVLNHARGVDLLQARDEVDPERIGVIGHSLGGHNAMFLGAFDPRVKVIVASCGWTPFHDYYGGNLAGWAQDRYMPRIRSEYGNDPDRMPFDFYEVAAALAPRAFFSNSPLKDDNFSVAGVKKAEPKVREVYSLLGNADRLKIVYPDSAHDFPPEVRREAYQFIDTCLQHQPKE